MKTHNFTHPNNLSLLHDELIAAIPGFHRTVLAPDGTNEVAPDCGQVRGRGEAILITCADDITRAQLETVVQAHDSTQLQPDTRRDRLARITEISAIPWSQWTAAQMRELIDLLAKERTS